MRIFAVVAIVSLLFAACSPGSRPLPTVPSGALPPCEIMDVVHVIDGDTIVVNDGARDIRIRYIGVDTPETGAGDTTPEPFHAEATALNERLADDRVCLEKDQSELDRSGRTLRYAWTLDGTLINEALLRQGLAQVVTFPPDVKYVESRYLPAQRAARSESLGIWSD